MDGRAQSESIGVILLTVVVIIIATLGAAVVLDGVGGDGDSAPLVEFTVEMTASEIAVTHAGGDAVAQSELTIIARGDSTEKRYGFDAANVSGDGDGQFEPSERFRRGHGFAGTTVDVLVVHDASNSVLTRETVTVGERGEGLPPAARFSATPDDPDPGETVTFDASASTDRDGSIATYRWAFGDGTTTETATPTVTHSYGSEGDYTVELTVVDDDGATDTTNRTYSVTTLRAPDDPEGVTSGLGYEYYEGTYTSLPEFDAEAPVATGTVANFDIGPRERDDNFAFRYTGYVEVPEDGQYTFTTDSDDGSRLYIGDEQVVDNPGRHAARERSGTIGLQSGRHEVTVTYFEHTGQEVLDVRWSGPGISGEEAVPSGRLYRDDDPTATFEPSCGGLDCTFDGSVSDGGDGTIASYEWEFGDGTTATTTTPTVDHSYASEGDYTVELTVVDDGGRTDTTTRTVTVVEPRPAASPGETASGLAYSYYEADPIDDRSDLQPSAIVRNGTTDGFDLEPAHREENFGFRYTGYVEVPETGNYTFYTTSDDGSRLYIGDELVVQNDGLHAAEIRSGEIALEAGKHPVTVTYFEHTIDDTLTVEYAGPGVSRQAIPASALSRDRETARWETAADWDGAVAGESVVHDSVGDRRADRLQLGYGTTDAGGSNLTGYWPLDEDGGSTVSDASDSGYDGTPNAVTPGLPGTVGTTAYGFDDTGWVEVDGFPNIDRELTISAWIRTTDTTEQGQRIFVDDANNTGGYALSLGDDGVGRLRFYSRGVSPVSLDTGRVVETGRWYHVAAVMDQAENERRIYVNGSLVASDSYSGTWGTDDGAASIGGETADGETENRFAGRVDEVRVYDRALSGTEIERLDRTGRNGTLTTGTRTFDYAVSPSALSLENVSATRPPGTSVTATVLSDPDGDGTFEERSDTVTLDGSASYDVTGLSTDSRRYRLDVELNTSNPTATPAVDRLELSG